MSRTTKAPAKRRRRGTRPGLTREESRQLTRSRLIAAGKREFARTGLQGTNLTDILKRAEVSPGAFYHHFQDKTELFLAVMDELSLTTRKMLRDSRAALRNPGDDLEAWVTGIFRQGLLLAETDGDFFLIFAREMTAGNARVQAFFEHDRALFRQEVKDALDELIERDFLPPFDTAWAAYQIGIITLSLMLEQLTKPAERETWCRATAQFILHGVPGLRALDARPPSRPDAAESPATVEGAAP